MEKQASPVPLRNVLKIGLLLYMEGVRWTEYFFVPPPSPAHAQSKNKNTPQKKKSYRSSRGDRAAVLRSREDTAGSRAISLAQTYGIAAADVRVTSYLVADEVRDRRRGPSSIFCLGFPASAAASDGAITEPQGRSGLQAACACVESPHSAHRCRGGSPGPPLPLNPMDEAVPRTADAGTTTAARYRNIRVCRIISSMPWNKATCLTSSKQRCRIKRRPKQASSQFRKKNSFLA
ncbi:uncharacterized protein [Triticum aestivum]|uniref:uncharacterized protein n=1 Tax=Triticum aestivum TaxID=4565 RepID=UPI001D019D6C|nr:uncharacterized protein LOC123152983 [Triticum aestivum]